MMQPWAARYLGYLELDPEPPNLGYLRRLSRAHLMKVPYENITKFIYYQGRPSFNWILPPIERYVENLTERGWSGTCYLNNASFRALLEQVGFRSRHVHVDGAGHLGIVVQLPEGDFYADVGLGGPIFDPVPLPEGGLRVHCGRGNRFIPMAEKAGSYRLHHLVDGEVKIDWEFQPYREVTLASVWDYVERSNTAGSFFMTQLVCSLWQEERHLALRNNQFTIRGLDARQQVTRLKSVEELEDLLAREFHRPNLPVREAVEILASLGVDIFAPPPVAG